MTFDFSQAKTALKTKTELQRSVLRGSVEMAGVEPASERFDPRIYYEHSLFIDLTS